MVSIREYDYSGKLSEYLLSKKLDALSGFPFFMNKNKQRQLIFVSI